MIQMASTRSMATATSASTNPASSDERSSYDGSHEPLCPTCQRPIPDRAGDQQGRHYGDCDCEYWASQEHGEGPCGNVAWFAYVPIARRGEWEALGWRVTDALGYYHSQFSLLGEWRGEGEPIKPPSR